MLINNESEKIILSVNGKKLAVPSNDQSIDKISNHLPPEVAALLANMQHSDTNEATNITANTKIKDLTGISQTSPSMDLRDLVDSIVNKEQSVVRAVPEVVQRAQEQQKALEEIRNNPEKKFTIYESGVALGIVISSSNKQDVVNIMKEYSRIKFSPTQTDLIFFYNDIGVTVYFNDDEVVSELQFGDNYKGATSQGLKIGNSVEKAIQLYGSPRMKTTKGAIWPHLGVFCQCDYICTIRLQK